MNLEVDADGWIYMNAFAVARIVPNLSLGSRREFEEWIEVGNSRERTKIIEDAKDNAQAEHEAKPTIEEIRKELFETLGEKVIRRELITLDEFKQAFERVADELAKPDR